MPRWALRLSGELRKGALALRTHRQTADTLISSSHGRGQSCSKIDICSSCATAFCVENLKAIRHPSHSPTLSLGKVFPVTALKYMHLIDLSRPSSSYDITSLAAFLKHKTETNFSSMQFSFNISKHDKYRHILHPINQLWAGTEHGLDNVNTFTLVFTMGCYTNNFTESYMSKKHLFSWCSGHESLLKVEMKLPLFSMCGCWPSDHFNLQRHMGHWTQLSPKSTWILIGLYSSMFSVLFQKQIQSDPFVDWEHLFTSVTPTFTNAFVHTFIHTQWLYKAYLHMKSMVTQAHRLAPPSASTQYHISRSQGSLH